MSIHIVIKCLVGSTILRVNLGYSRIDDSVPSKIIVNKPKRTSINLSILLEHNPESKKPTQN